MNVMKIEHSVVLRVRYAETDQMQVAHHSVWPLYWEVARTELIRSRLKPYAALEREDGILLPVVDYGAEILAPLRYDDEIRVTARIQQIGRVRLRFAYEARVRGELVARGHSVHAVVGPDWKPVRLPAALAAGLGGR